MNVFVFLILMVYCIVCAIAAVTDVGRLHIHLFSCKAASVFNKLPWLLTSFEYLFSAVGLVTALTSNNKSSSLCLQLDQSLLNDNN